MSASRRTFCTGSVPALLGFVELFQSMHAAATPAELQSFTTTFESMKAQNHGASTFRAICDGTTATGVRAEVHETQLESGAEPHPPHRHKHEEFLLIMKGTVETTIDGKSATLTPGSVGFWSSMSLHHLRNIGPDTAQYFVVSIGNDA